MAFEEPSCFIVGEVEGAATQVQPADPVPYIKIKILGTDHSDCPVISGQVFQITGDYSWILKEGDRIKVGVKKVPGMDTAGADDFLIWLNMTYEDGTLIPFPGDNTPVLLSNAKSVSFQAVTEETVVITLNKKDQNEDTSDVMASVDDQQQSVMLSVNHKNIFIYFYFFSAFLILILVVFLKKSKK